MGNPIEPNDSVPDDYLERVYAGVLGKLIGVYLGRPIEQRPHKFIIEEYGPVRYYLNDKVPMNLVDADDDISGTFAFIRALEEHGATHDISAENIGKTWLNNAIEHKCPFWWGGKGYSTEHTAFANLRRGIPAPKSGSIEQNGKTIAEQIGGQIFVDGWAMVAPGQPALAAKLADVSASVSHDGEAKYAAKLWAAMEAEAFVSKDIEHLLDTGLRFIPPNSMLAKVISDVRGWSTSEPDWLKTRQKIEVWYLNNQSWTEYELTFEQDTYGYDKFAGSCHVMPNHAIMIMTLIYGGQSFHEALHIINTSGWDTDCNSGNVGCLMGIMHGINGIDHGGPDWRGPVADRAVVASADGGYTTNNAARIAYDIANSGRKVARLAALSTPKDAQFHFTLPGSVQGFRVASNSLAPDAELKQTKEDDDRTGLQIKFKNLDKTSEPIQVLTPTFVQPETRKIVQGYQYVGCPLVYPGQKVTAGLWADATNTAGVTITLRLQVYSPNPEPAQAKLYEANPDLDMLRTVDGPTTTLAPGNSTALEWVIPDNMDSQPIANIGFAVTSSISHQEGSVTLDYLRWDGTPNMTIRRPSKAVINPSEAWRESWINNASTFHWYMPQTFGISQTQGEGNLIYGTREWVDYRVTASRFKVSLAAAGGLMVRNQGLNRYYAFMFATGGKVILVKAEDERRVELATTPFDWTLDKEYEISITASGSSLRFDVDGKSILEGNDDRFACGGMGLVVLDGAISAEEFRISSV